jgi:tRNA (guanine37-N1)-methyltransferase
MVMKPEPWWTALTAVTEAGPGATQPVLVVPTPSGRRFSQRDAQRLAGLPWLIFACGRYEGIDARIAERARARMPVEELSIGDYVLAGGEAATLVIVEAVARLLPGVVGNADSVTDDSFAAGAMSGLIEGPVYTKPADWDGMAIPQVLQSGNHGAVARWRRDQALRRSATNRPDLIAGLDRPARRPGSRGAGRGRLGPEALLPMTVSTPVRECPGQRLIGNGDKGGGAS